MGQDTCWMLQGYEGGVLEGHCAPATVESIWMLYSFNISKACSHTAVIYTRADAYLTSCQVSHNVLTSSLFPAYRPVAQNCLISLFIVVCIVIAVYSPVNWIQNSGTEESFLGQMYISVCWLENTDTIREDLIIPTTFLWIFIALFLPNNSVAEPLGSKHKHKHVSSVLVQFEGRTWRMCRLHKKRECWGP